MSEVFKNIVNISVLITFNSKKASAPSGKREYRFKIIVVGALGTGKTSIIKRFVNNYFSKNYKATVSWSAVIFILLKIIIPKI